MEKTAEVGAVFFIGQLLTFLTKYDKAIMGVQTERNKRYKPSKKGEVTMRISCPRCGAEGQEPRDVLEITHCQCGQPLVNFKGCAMVDPRELGKDAESARGEIFRAVMGVIANAVLPNTQPSSREAEATPKLDPGLSKRQKKASPITEDEEKRFRKGEDGLRLLDIPAAFKAIFG